MSEAIVSWIEGGTLNTWVLGSSWIWPTMETLHFVGLSLMFGALLVIDLRLAGFFREFREAGPRRAVVRQENARRQGDSLSVRFDVERGADRGAGGCPVCVVGLLAIEQRVVTR